MLLRDAFVIDSAADDRSLVLSYGPCQVWWLGSTLLMILNLITITYPIIILFFISAVPYTWLCGWTILGDTISWTWGVLDNQLFSQIWRGHCGVQLDVSSGCLTALYHSYICLWFLLKWNCFLISQAWTSLWLHLCSYSLWDVCRGAICNCMLCWNIVVGANSDLMVLF